MSVDTDALIDRIVETGKVELESWPSLLKIFLERIDDISENCFPPPVPKPISSNIGNTLVNVSTITEIHNEAESPIEEMDTATDSMQAELPEISPPAEPPVATPSPEALAMIAEIKETLSTTFANAPPHTVQRLAELLKSPKQHYRVLIKFLRAVQRVVSVSSTINQFPLPSSMDPPGSGVFTTLLGSDEGLGGALLTPISWLKSEGDVQFDTGMNGVSQGELIRQEQELGIAPHSTNGDNGDDRVQVHAQGPSAIGPEDLGPQPPGVVFPDLGSPPSESALLLDAETLAKQDEMMDLAMSAIETPENGLPSPEASPFTGLSPFPEDRMDVDKATDEKEEEAKGDSTSTEGTESADNTNTNQAGSNST